MSRRIASRLLPFTAALFVVALAAPVSAQAAAQAAGSPLASPAAQAPAEATAKRPITHEDVWLMQRVGGPVLSPDGTRVVFTVTEPSYDEATQSTDLWIAPVDGSEPPRRLTATRSGESAPAWSPDGRRLAFVARRDNDEVGQVYVLDLAGGGEAQRLTSLTLGARGPKWSPDGTHLLFGSDVYPGAATEEQNKAAAADRKARKWNARVYDGFPIRNWDRWNDERRPSLFVQKVDGSAPARDLLASTTLVAGPGFGGQGGSGSESIAATWTPDGAAVVFAATTNRQRAAFAEVVHSLYQVPLAGGEPRRLTADAASYGAPTFSPDGRTLLARMEPATAFVYNASRLVGWAWPAMSGPTMIVTGFDRAVGDFDVAPDNATVYFLAEDAGHERLYRAPLAGGGAQEVGTLAAGCYTNLAVGGVAASPVLVANHDSSVAPPEVVRIDTKGAATPITRFNAERAAQIDWKAVQAFWFTSSVGRRVHSFIALPPGFDPAKKYPLLVLIHGGPHSQWRDQFVIRWNYHLLASPGYVVLLTNYTGSTGFGERFAQNIQGDPLEGPANEINQAADEAIKRFPFIDGARQVAGGASYGGHLTNWLAVTTGRYKALISHAGLFDLRSQWATSDTIYSRERNMGTPPWDGANWREHSPFFKAANLSTFKTPILVTVGERDFRVPMNNAIEFWSVLQRQQVPSRLIVFPDENHWVLKGENSRFFYGQVHEWIQRHVGTR